MHPIFVLSSLVSLMKHTDYTVPNFTKKRKEKKKKRQKVGIYIFVGLYRVNVRTPRTKHESLVQIQE